MKVFFFFFLILFFVSCGVKTPLPDVITSPDFFGANDTSYIHLTPDWDASYMGYSKANMEPVDITIGSDGYIFVADQANNQVICLSQSGQIIKSQNLNTIYPIKNPTGLDIDSKLNLLMVNGTDTIYAWNQYANNIGIISVITGIDSSTHDYIYSNDPALINIYEGIYPVYVDNDPNARFQDITFGPTKDNTVFVTDNGTNRILKLNFLTLSGVKLANNNLHPLYGCIYEKTIASFGSGAGTVDNPRGITSDENGNIYFTQMGGNFLVQKLLGTDGSYSSAYVLYEDPIMDLNRFKGPTDIALGKDDAIFVVDAADSGRVSKFYNKGLNAGAQVDLGKEGLVNARFNDPMSIVVSDEEIVYITNTMDHKIERYQYTISKEDIPQEPK